MQQPSKTLTQVVFVVVVDEVLVAQDIRLIIGDVKPDAEVVIARHLDDALADVPQGRVAAAFVQQDAPLVWSSALGRRMADDNGILILIGADLAHKSEKVHVLPLPFSREDVAAVLAAVHDL